MDIGSVHRKIDKEERHMNSENVSVLFTCTFRLPSVRLYTGDIDLGPSQIWASWPVLLSQ